MLGILGSEDLGSGLRATFNIESGIELDTGDASNGTGFWRRRAVVGLAGVAGELPTKLKFLRAAPAFSL